MGLQKRLVKAALGKQASKGTPVSGDYGFGVLGGTVASAEITEDDLNPTSDVRNLENRERTLVVPGAEFDVLAMPSMLGLLLLGACGAVSTTDTSGTGVGPYEHVFSPADDLPYLTVLGKYVNDTYEVSDAKLDELEVSWDGSGAVEVASTLTGLGINPAGTYGATTEERPLDVLRAAGGTFQIDGAAAKVLSGSVTVTNNLEAIALANSVSPDDVFPGMQAVEVSLTVVPENLDLFRTILTGSATGTAVSDDPHFGALAVSFANAGGDSLAFDAAKVAFMTEFPEADPEGGPAELELEGIVVRPDDGSDAFTSTLTNGVASY